MTNINRPDPINMSQMSGLDAATTEQTSAASSEFKPLDGVDGVHVVVQQFLSASRWGKKEYQADPSHPTLLPPEANEGGPTPLDRPWQIAMNRQFMNLIRESQIKKIMESKKTSEPFQENSKTLLDEKPLLRNPDGNASQQQDPPELSEPQIERKVNTILQAVSSGKVSTLDEDDQKDVTEATKKIQEEFHLPTWNFGTLEAKDLTPTKEIEPPIEVATARGEVLLKNIDDLSSSIQKAADTMLKETPKNDPKSLAVGDLVKIITQAISELKQVLQDMQLAESKITSKMATLKTEQKQEHLEKIKEAMKKQAEAEKKQREQKRIAGIMKIVAPVVTGLVAIAAVVFAVLSVGTAAAPLAIAVAVVSSIMFAYTVVDTQKGYTQQLIEEINNSMADMPTWKADLFKSLILIVVVLVLVLAIMASGGTAAVGIGTTAGTTAAGTGAAAGAGAAGAAAGAGAAVGTGAAGAAAGASAATTVTTTTTAQVAKEVALQLAIQSSMMFIMSSNILPDLVVDSCVAAGAVSKDDQKTIMMIKLIIMALTLIVCMEAMAKGQGLITSGAKMVSEGAQAALKNTQTLIKNVSEATMESTKAAIQQSLAELNKAIQAMLKNLAESVEPLITKPLTTISDATLESLKATWNGLKDILANQENMAKFAHNCEDFFKISGLGVDAGFSIYLGTLSLQLANIFRQLGDVEKEKEVLQALIQLFEKLLSSIQADQTGKADWISNLTRAMDNMYASESIMSTKATQQYSA